jgi:crotonobetainyl-CoA:carnitine CoA-transferase CaiB-like acyl-CoA transferase
MASTTAPPPPLADTLVVSVGHTLPGLYCMAALRDLGAEVVCIERSAPATTYAGLANSHPVRSLRAGTSRCGLDLKQPAGRDAYVRLARRADVVLEGFRPGVAARLGIDWTRLSAEHERLVYVAISGYGQDGPLRERAGHDVNYLAETGALSLVDPPALPGPTYADGLAGLSAALNAVAALHAARASGRGQLIDLAIVDAPLFLMSAELDHYFRTGESRPAGATHLSGRYPWYGVHRTADGGAMAVGAVEPPFHAALCERLGHPELADMQLAADDAKTRSVFADAFAARSRDDHTASFDGSDACVSPVLPIGEVASSALMPRALRISTDGERLVRSPVRVPPPPLPRERVGRELLAHLGFTDDEIAALEHARALGMD